MLDLSLLSPRRNYLLGLSGGRDSVCLLRLLWEKKIRRLHLVHLNHQLRGKDSDGDAASVATLAKELRLPLTSRSVPISDWAEKGGESLETTARLARHELFAQVARETSCSRVLLAHHADDQAETCLFNLLRGSAGIKGMSSESEILVGRKRLTLLRPLLHTRRSQIDAYLVENGLGYREDASNRDPSHTRNRLRHEALPLLQEILQRDIVPSLLRAEVATRAKDEIIADLLDHLQLRDPQGRLFLPQVKKLSPALQRACLEQFLRENQISGISKELIDRCLLLINPAGPPALNLPGNRFLRRKEGRIFLA